MNRAQRVLSLSVLTAVAATACGTRSASVSSPESSRSARNVLPAVEPLPEAGTETRDPRPDPGFDVQHYDLTVDLTGIADSTMSGRTVISLRVDTGLDLIDLDFVGMTVEHVAVDGEPASGVTRTPELLRIPIDAASTSRDVAVEIAYTGRPDDGLFFGPDANGTVTAFADNWPNRARWWFPSYDHPSDKASVSYEVIVPSGYSVIANGALQDVRDAAVEGEVWSWRTDPGAPIPTYTMVIGVAPFERRPIGDAACGRSPVSPTDCAAVSIWALAGDGDYGEQRFQDADEMLDFYTELVAPYPYEKLAHVESSTRFGGMENSSAIFYSNRGWAAREMGEGVIAHETAHQWFGDAVTPASWGHLWVSEGFASYFGPLFFLERDGEEAFQGMMARSRDAVLGSDRSAEPIVGGSRDLFSLLNTNNYQKGAWVLHMLRSQLGDEAFYAGVRDYYRNHLHGTADTEDLRAALEAASGEDLSAFFQQWIYSPGFADLQVTWRRSGNTVVVDFAQRQDAGWPTYDLPIELEVVGTVAVLRTTHRLDTREGTLRIPWEPALGDPTELRVDPHQKLLMRSEVREAGSP